MQGAGVGGVRAAYALELGHDPAQKAASSGVSERGRVGVRGRSASGESSTGRSGWA
ncbi:MAG: hypothetical protein ACLS6G_01925 [Christensenellales bacterium]